MRSKGAARTERCLSVFDLKPGPLVFTVTSDPYTPYYLPTQIATNVPMPSPCGLHFRIRQ